jgi:hypothetical protein
MDEPMVAPPPPKYKDEPEPFIPYAGMDKCPPPLKAQLEGMEKRMGFLANSMKLYMHSPYVLEAVLNIGKNIAANPKGALPQELKRKLGVICSAINGCVYSATHQVNYLLKPPGSDEEGFGLSLDDIKDLIAGTDTPADEIERVCIDFARAASRDPNNVPDEIRNRLKRLLTSEQIMELAGFIGYRKFVDTIHAAIELPLERSLLQHSGYIDAWKPAS